MNWESIKDFLGIVALIAIMLLGHSCYYDDLQEYKQLKEGARYAKVDR